MSNSGIARTPWLRAYLFFFLCTLTSESLPKASAEGLIPCRESTLFRNSKASALKTISTSYTASATYEEFANVQSSLNTLSRLEAYETAGFLCGSSDGLPRILPNSSGFFLTGSAFIYIAGCISRAVRTYSRFTTKLADPTAQTEREAKIDLVVAAGAFAVSLIWPVLLPADLRREKLVTPDSNVTVSPR
jgi:hypothetical protein